MLRLGGRGLAHRQGGLCFAGGPLAYVGASFSLLCLRVQVVQTVGTRFLDEGSENH